MTNYKNNYQNDNEKIDNSVRENSVDFTIESLNSLDDLKCEFANNSNLNSKE